MSDMVQTFHTATGFHKAGRLDKAKRLCQQILEQDAGHCPALRALGLIAQQEQDNRLAVELIRRAIAVHPQMAQ